MNQIQVTCDKECIYRNDGFCECDQHLLDIAEEFLRLKRGEEVEHLKERESIGAASMEDCSKYEWDFLHESIWINPYVAAAAEARKMICQNCGVNVVFAPQFFRTKTAYYIRIK